MAFASKCLSKSGPLSALHGSSSSLYRQFPIPLGRTPASSGRMASIFASSNPVSDVVEKVTAPAKQAAEMAILGTPPVRGPSVHDNTPHLTTNAGAPVDNNDHTMTVGPRGPALLQDQFFLEKMQQFDREKTPERVVHARGMTAKGHFEVTHDVSHLTCADFLSKTGKKTEVAVRFSTVTHEKGSPESLRDVRGFSTKFYTQQGNWDLVANNIPVFFIRDGMKFPDLVHALRPNPKNHIQEGWRILDFLSHHPESAHILTWLLDDPGIPANWRALEGYGVNTFTLFNADGKEVYVKFHWRPEGGAKFLKDEEAKEVGQFNMRHSHATHDLYNAIDAGDHPVWNFYFQIMDPATELDYDFDPLDCTKVWPEEQFPLQPVGRMTLDRNIDNFQLESEQIAFSPGVAVPGIGFSNDKVLQTRVFSYGDTQRYRLGVNYQMLPINMPKCPFHNNHHDGAMNFMQKDDEVNYWPTEAKAPQFHNMGNTGSPKPNPEVTKVNVNKEHLSGVRTKEDIGTNGGKWDDFKQAGIRYRSLPQDRQETFIEHVVSWTSDPKCPPTVRDKWYDIWGKVDAGLAEKVKTQVSAKIAEAPSKVPGATMA